MRALFVFLKGILVVRKMYVARWVGEEEVGKGLNSGVAWGQPKCGNMSVFLGQGMELFRLEDIFGALMCIYIIFVFSQNKDNF